MPEFFEGTKWLVEERKEYWIPNITEKSVAKLPKCISCGRVFGTVALDYNYCPQCGENMRMQGDKIMDKQNIEKELYKSFITRLIHCTDGARYEEDMVDDYWGLICNMKREYKEKYGEEVE